jgi:hypothetical protein
VSSAKASLSPAWALVSTVSIIESYLLARGHLL